MIREIVGYFSDLKSKKNRSKTLKLILVIFVHYDVMEKNPKTTPTFMLRYTTDLLTLLVNSKNKFTI